MGDTTMIARSIFRDLHMGWLDSNTHGQSRPLLARIIDKLSARVRGTAAHAMETLKRQHANEDEEDWF